MNIHRNARLAACAAAVVLLGAGASAQAQHAIAPDPTTAPDPRMMKLDRNGDGVIDKSEADAGLRKVFDQWDANGDGTIDAAEYAAGGLPSRPHGGTSH